MTRSNDYLNAYLGTGTTTNSESVSRLFNGGNYPNPNHPDAPWFSTLIENVESTNRWNRAVLAMFADDKRNLDQELGYKSADQRTVHDYRKLYDNEPLAARVVEVLPEESWQVPPEIYEEEDLDTETEFERAWYDLGQTLGGSHGLLDTEEAHPVWSYLERADVVSGIGRYGVILLGVSDIGDLEQPLQLADIEPVKRPLRKKTAKSAKLQQSPQSEQSPQNADSVEFGEPETGTGVNPTWKPKHKLLYLRVVDESLAQIDSWETEKSSPRYGLPKYYTISFSGADNQIEGIVAADQLTTRRVHWSRVIHIADHLVTSEVLAYPRLQQVYNRLYDLHKLYGGSAEMYWRGAFPGLSFETHPNQAIPQFSAAEKTAMRGQIEAYYRGLDRAFTIPGLTLKSVAPQVADPSNHIDKEIEAICIRLGIPKRVFMGSERGELASSQDADTWKDRVRKRQGRYITPRLIAPLVNRLIQAGILPQPKRYYVYWPDNDAQTATERADIAVKVTQALAAFVSGGVDSVMTVLDYLVNVCGFDKDVATQIVQNKNAELAEEPSDTTLDIHVREDEMKEEEAQRAAEEAERTQGNTEAELKIKAEAIKAKANLPPKGL